MVEGSKFMVLLVLAMWRPNRPGDSRNPWLWDRLCLHTMYHIPCAICNLPYTAHRTLYYIYCILCTMYGMYHIRHSMHHMPYTMYHSYVPCTMCHAPETMLLLWGAPQFSRSTPERLGLRGRAECRGALHSGVPEAESFF